MVNSNALLPLIAIEEHFLIEEVLQVWHDSGLSATDPSLAHNTGKTGERLLDLAQERLALMDEAGVDIQVLSLTTPALHELGAASVDIARRCNDAIAEAIVRHPGRFQGFATLPVSDPQAAAMELERCVNTLGFKGTMLSGRVGDRNLDHPYFMPIFESASMLGTPVLLHPRTPPAAVREAYYSDLSPELDVAIATYGLGWHYDAGLQFVRLMVSGIFDRLPELQIILGHWGELVLFYAERLAVMGRVGNLKKPVSDYLKSNLYVTASGMFLPHYLERAASIVGKERLLFSTDFPYQYRPGHEARQFLDNCGLSGEDLSGFAHANWERLTQNCGKQEMQ
ncbi:amidohydrolase family protein [Pantoea agglomerans]|uniref:amidohydrolase family protein n=1 Tax=Enterobacter agglomerans TaxID=549 RepID=UPI0013CBCA80|nr:amidohydrolase family protein [Pantoea agglomerans]NEG65005.1 amidohydrolase family protein [Pantoea agglomerans]